MSLAPEDSEKVWKHIIAGAGAGWATALVTCPLDVVKVRLQTTSNTMIPLPRNNNQLSSKPLSITISSLTSIWRREGVHGMYRGLGPMLFAYLPAFSIYFPTYQYCKIHLSRWRNRRVNSDTVSHLFSAMLAGASSNLFTNPLWVIRTRLMTQHFLAERIIYTGSIDAFKTIYRKEGVKGFYKGAIASTLGVAHVAVQFPLYEWLKQIQCQNNNSQELTTVNILLASTSAKIVASTITYPHEVIRTRLQIQRDDTITTYSGVLDAIRKIWHREGFLGFYRGIFTNIIRVIPASGVTFLTFEFIIKYLS